MCIFGVSLARGHPSSSECFLENYVSTIQAQPHLDWRVKILLLVLILKILTQLLQSLSTLCIYFKYLPFIEFNICIKNLLNIYYIKEAVEIYMYALFIHSKMYTSNLL